MYILNTYVNMHIVHNRTAYVVTFMNEFVFIIMTAITIDVIFCWCFW